MEALDTAWPAPLTLVLADSELRQAWHQDGQCGIELASALVRWPDSRQRQPQQGWVWPLRLQCSGVRAWQSQGLMPGRIATAVLLLDDQPLAPVLPARHAGRLSLALELTHGGQLRLQARTLCISLEGAQLRESLAC